MCVDRVEDTKCGRENLKSSLLCTLFMLFFCENRLRIFCLNPTTKTKTMYPKQQIPELILLHGELPQPITLSTLRESWI